MCEFNLNEAGEWIKIVAAGLSPILVVIGWGWVNSKNNDRERRKEIRQLVDRTLADIATTVELAKNYYGRSQRGSPDLEAWSILIALRRVSENLQILERAGLNLGDSSSAYLELKRTLTGADFMTHAWKRWEDDDQRWLELVSTPTALSSALEGSFINAFFGQSAGKNYG